MCNPWRVWGHPSRGLCLRRAQTVGELCNTLSVFGGSAVDKLSHQSDAPRIQDLNATLAACGIVGTVRLRVTFRKQLALSSGLRVDTGVITGDSSSTRSIFKTITVPFDSTPFGLELEVRGCLAP